MTTPKRPRSTPSKTASTAPRKSAARATAAGSTPARKAAPPRTRAAADTTAPRKTAARKTAAAGVRQIVDGKLSKPVRAPRAARPRVAADPTAAPRKRASPVTAATGTAAAKRGSKVTTVKAVAAPPQDGLPKRKRGGKTVSAVEALRQAVLNALEEMKGREVLALDVREQTSVTDWFVIVSGTSSRHVKSLAEEVVKAAKAMGLPPLGVEGEREGEWVVVDLADVVVHVMQPRVREFYALEKLWGVPAAAGPSAYADPDADA